ncbi:serpin family protein [Sphaerisporangium sp. NPDC005288]|uniref:serpin family protein n=1 Tax=Sphaerisporangium sp. NPDC005288 TaxID=3155114 RepID=UPI0033A18808
MSGRLPRRGFLLAALAALAAAGCGGGDTRVLTASGVGRETPADDAPVAEVVRGVTAFGHALHAAAADAARNAVLSPLSIAFAFAMARAGAAGPAATVLDRVFGFPATGPHTAFNALTRRIVTVQGPPPPPDRRAERDAREQSAGPVAGIANGLFAQEGLPVRQEFLRVLAAQYGAGVRTVDFGGDAAGAINAWVDEQTAGRITKLFDRLDPATRVVIANAVYLKADWEHPFAESPPEQGAAFTRADGSIVRADLMRLRTSLRYAEGTGWQAVELPYVKSELAMWVLVPRRGGSPADLLAPGTLGQVATGLRPRAVDLALPEWDFGTGLDLEAPLRRVGLGAVFDGGDFSGIAEGAFLGQAIHRADISVDKWGTEAAAVTGLAFPTAGLAEQPIEVRADHPFAFAIVHRPTTAPLFIGHVADPTATT